MKILSTMLTIAVAVVGLMMTAWGIRMFFRKEKEFKRHHTNTDPTTGRCTNCTCDKKPVK